MKVRISPVPLKAGVWTALLALVITAGCGANSDALHGLVRTDPMVVSSVVLPDATGGASSKTLTMQAESGRYLIAYFGYTSCPDVCPTTLADLKLAFAKVGAPADRLDVAFVTVDFARDTPAVLTTYLAQFLPRARAIRPADTTQLQQAEAAFGASSSVITQPDGTIDVSHTAITYVIDDRGRVVVEWPFGTKRDDIASDLKILLSRLDA